MPSTIPAQMYLLMDDVLHSSDYAAYVLDGQSAQIDSDDPDNWHDVIAVVDPGTNVGEEEIHKFTYDPEHHKVLHQKLGKLTFSTESQAHSLPSATTTQQWSFTQISENVLEVTQADNGDTHQVHREDADPEHRFVWVRMAAAWFANAPAR